MYSFKWTGEGSDHWALFKQQEGSPWSLFHHSGPLTPAWAAPLCSDGELPPGLERYSVFSTPDA